MCFHLCVKAWVCVCVFTCDSLMSGESTMGVITFTATCVCVCLIVCVCVMCDSFGTQEFCASNCLERRIQTIYNCIKETIAGFKVHPSFHSTNICRWETRVSWWKSASVHALFWLWSINGGSWELYLLTDEPVRDQTAKQCGRNNCWLFWKTKICYIGSCFWLKRVSDVLTYGFL